MAVGSTVQLKTHRNCNSTTNCCFIYLNEIIIAADFPTPRKHVLVRFEVFTAVTMKNAVFWDIKTQFLPHRRHITSPLPRSVG
jgi:hypothetical protein